MRDDPGVTIEDLDEIDGLIDVPPKTSKMKTKAKAWPPRIGES